MNAPAKAKLTADDYFQRPETTQHQHLLDGAIIEMTPPNIDHQETVGNIFIWIKTKTRTIGGRVFVAPTGVLLSPHDVVEPDICWVSSERSSIIEARYINGAPDFVAEVLSPSTTRFDRREKFRLYERFGVRELWLADLAARLIEVWRLEAGKFAFIDAYGSGETFESALFGAVEVDALFPPAPVEAP